MAKDKERSINPAAAHRKAEKQKAVKKGKAAVAAQRTERFAHRNPDRLQAQIDELKALESSSGSLSARDKKSLDELVRDVARIHKAKEILGDNPSDRSYGQSVLENTRGRSQSRHGNALGKRVRDNTQVQETDSSDTEEDVRNIPMPRDTPPPLPVPRHRRVLGPKSQSSTISREPSTQADNPSSTAAPLVAKTVYESAPQVRNLRKEAATFLPNAVRRKVASAKGQTEGRYLEPEEFDALESQGYMGGTLGKSQPLKISEDSAEKQQVQIEEVGDDGT